MVHYILSTSEAHFTIVAVNSTQNSHVWDRDSPHETAESNYQHCVFINVWSGGICDQLIGTYTFLQCLTGGIFASFLKHELPALVENVPVRM
jgi:hypothetical protein